MTKTEIKKTSKKYRQIIETGKGLFLKFGPKRVTIEEICKEANVSKVTFYKYFENKKALIRAIRDELMDIGFSKFDEISALDISYPEKIKMMSKWRLEFFSQIQSEFLDEILEMDKVVEESKKRYLKNITDAQRKGEIRSELSPELIWLVTEKLREITIEGSWRKIFDDYGQYQDQVRTMMFFGMLSSEEE